MATDIKFSSVSITNGVSNVNTTDTYSSGTPLLITVIADDNFFFNVSPYIRYKDSIGSWNKVNMQTDEISEYPTSFYIVIDDNFISSHYITTYQGVATLQVGGIAERIPKVDKYGIINMYNPTPQELKEIGNVRYYSGGGEMIDLGNFISSLIKVFVKIPTNDKVPVLLGGYNTGVESTVIDDDIVETDCGTIHIDGIYKNAMDYENTKVEIYLPLIGFKTLDTEKVMNETLSLFYKTNLINGDCIACIYNTTGTLLYTFNSKASFEIPYKMNATDEPQGKVEVNSNYLFGFTPFVSIRYNKSYNAASVAASDDRETTLETMQGYVKCSEVFNTIRATTAEKEEIDNLLKNGVIIS